MRVDGEGCCGLVRAGGEGCCGLVRVAGEGWWCGLVRVAGEGCWLVGYHCSGDRTLESEARGPDFLGDVSSRSCVCYGGREDCKCHSGRVLLT